MRWTKRIIITFNGQIDVHRIRNFGEDLYREYRETRKAHISLDEIDKAVDRISFKVVSPLRKPAVQFTWKLLRQHGFEGIAEVSVDDIDR